MQAERLSRYQKYLKLLQNTWLRREDVQAYTGLLLSLVAVAFFSWFAIRPTIITILELRSQIEEQQKILGRLTQKQEALSSTRSTWQAIENDLSNVNQAIPQTPEPENFARQLEALAGKENLSLSSFSLEKVNILSGETKPGINTFGAIVIVEGPVENILSFLSNISSLRRPLIWENLRITSKNPGIASSVTLSVSGLVPYEAIP